jgi:hypothetical protein
VQLRRPPAPRVEAPPAPPKALEPLIDVIEQHRVKGGRRCLVLSAASEGGAAETLAAEAGQFLRARGVRVEFVRLPGRATPAAAAVPELPLNLNQSDWMLRLQAWTSALPPDAVAVVVAPPLAGSAEAAQVARTCDGLLILVELGRTPRSELKLAVKRARNAGCAILGLIVVGSDGLPPWARRLLRP